MPFLRWAIAVSAESEDFEDEGALASLESAAENSLLLLVVLLSGGAGFMEGPVMTSCQSEGN